MKSDLSSSQIELLKILQTRPMKTFGDGWYTFTKGTGHINTTTARALIKKGYVMEQTDGKCELTDKAIEYLG